MISKEQPRLLCDMDGVIAHSQLPIIEEFNARFGTNLTYADWTSFDLLTLKAMQLSQENVAAVAAWLYAGEVMQRSEIVPGANQAIRVLSSMGTSPEVVTSRPSGQAEITRQWINNNLPEITGIHLRDGEALPMSGNQFKVYMIGQLEADIYIEDDPAVIDLVAQSISAGDLQHLKSLILVDRPWNDQYSLPSSSRRVGNWREADYGWDEIVQIVTEHINH